MKILLIIFFIILILNNKSYADHKEFTCTNMFAPWNSFLYHGNMFAPWNSMIHDSMFAPWNSIFCSKESTNAYMRERGFSETYFWP